MDKVIQHQYNLLTKLARWERAHERYVNLFKASRDGKGEVVYLNSPMLELVKFSRARIQKLREELRSINE